MALRSSSWWLGISVAAVLGPLVVGFVLGILAVVVGGLDPAFNLGMSDLMFGLLLKVLTGLAAGALVGFVGGIRGWQLLVPAAVGAIAGLLVALAVWAMNPDDDLFGTRGLIWGVWFAQSLGILLASSQTGARVVVGGAAAAVGGVILAVGLAAVPQPEPELYYVIGGYSLDSSTGTCSGSGVFSGVTEGSLLMAYDEESGEEVGAAVLRREPKLSKEMTLIFSYTPPMKEGAVSSTSVTHSDLVSTSTDNSTFSTSQTPRPVEEESTKKAIVSSSTSWHRRHKYTAHNGSRYVRAISCRVER